MLVLSRKTGESFTAGDLVKVTVLEVNGDRIKIGIKAPPTVKIMRTEVAETEKSNIDAVMSEGPASLEILKNALPRIEIGRNKRKER